MTNFKNIKTETLDEIFSMTSFNYESQISKNKDGTENINFDSKLDGEKFGKLYKELTND